MPPQTSVRRERLREQTVGELKRLALEQVAAGGAAAVSLNALGKAMGMSGPAVYRYFASREELLNVLVLDGYVELRAALEGAAAEARRRAPARRLGAAVDAYRSWALAHPQRYAMLFAPRPDGPTDSAAAIAEIHASMLVLLGALEALAGGHDDGGTRRDRLDTQLAGWAAARPGTGPASPLVLRLGVLTWTRLHGIVTLELAGVFAAMGVDAALLADAELDDVVARARAGA